MAPKRKLSDGDEGGEMALKRKRSDGGPDPPPADDPPPDGGPDPGIMEEMLEGEDAVAAVLDAQVQDGGPDPPPADDPPPVAEAGGPMVKIWSSDIKSVAVEFPQEHAYLILRNYFQPLDATPPLHEINETEKTKDERMGQMVESGVHCFELAPESYCTKEVLMCIRDYVRDYVNPNGFYKEAGEWNFDNDADLAIGERRAIGGTRGWGAQCWKLLEAAAFVDIEIWPDEAVKARNDSNQTDATNGVACLHAHSHPMFASLCISCTKIVCTHINKH